jgi:uncharacterized OB-fold protein/acyl dehydratase
LSQLGTSGHGNRGGESAGLEERLQSFVGASGGAPEIARDAVNLPMIRHWCDAIGDTNPVYRDPELAARSRHAGIVAPPTMLQAWTLPGLAPTSEKPPPSVLAQIVAELDEAGFVGVVATDCEQEYLRYLRPGDHLSLTTTIEGVSEQKQTALGTGYFVTSLMTFRDQADQTVGRMRFRILKFRPAAGAAAAAAAPAPRWPRPAINSDNAFFWEGAERGELLIQRCSTCGRLRHPPRPMCPACQSVEWDTVTACGRGIVYSFVVYHHPAVPPFEYPLVVGLIDLEEGTRIVSNVTGIEPSKVQIGMPVELCFSAVEEGLTLPQFRPTGQRQTSGPPDGQSKEGEKPPEVETLEPRTTTLRHGDVEIGQQIRALFIPLTPGLIVATAVASRDYQDVHHDRDAAQKAGSKDIFMNILSTNGFVGRYVTDWAGPDCTLKKVSLRLGAPNYPGDTMRVTGTVTAKRNEDDEGIVDLEVRGRNAYGDHVVADVVVSLPARGQG